MNMNAHSGIAKWSVIASHIFFTDKPLNPCNHL